MSNWQWQAQWQAQYNQLMSFLHLLVRESFIQALDNLLCAFRNCGFIFIGCAELQWRKLYGYKKTLTIPQISQLIHSICYTFHRLLTMPSTRTTKWVFCYDFHLVCSKFEPVIFRSKSRSKASVKKPASEILAEEVSPQVAPARWVFFSLCWFTSNAEQNLPQCISCQGWGQAPCPCHQWQWNVRVCLSSIFSANLLIFFCSEILETPTKHKKAKMAERPSPGSPEFEDLPPVTILYVFLPSFLWINNFHDVVVIRPGR